MSLPENPGERNPTPGGASQKRDKIDARSRASNASVQVQAERYSGFLPHPEHIRKWEEIIPGAAERILMMAEEQDRHRREIESLSIRSESRDSLLE